MRRRWFDRRAVFAGANTLAFLAAAWTLGQDAPQPANKQHVPAPDARKKAEALVRELYAGEYARASKDPAEKARLAATLLLEGKDTTDDPAGRYVLFCEARDLAAQAGDAPTALQAVLELAQDFALGPDDVSAMKVRALETAAAAPGSAESSRAVVDAALILLDEATAADNYDATLRLVATAEAAARKLKSVPLVLSIRRRGQEVHALRADYAQVKPYADTLRQNPGDPRANRELGKYQAFTKGNWAKALPLLAKADDATLKPLAQTDLARPRDAGAQADLARAWAGAADAASGPAKTQMLLRSYHWYQQALPRLRGPAHAAAARRMQAITDLLPPEYRAGELATEIRRLEGHRGPVFGVAFAPDGRKALSGGADGSVRLWDTHTGKELRRFDGHAGPVWAVVYSPDGRRALSGGFDARVRLWELASGREVRRFDGHTDYVRGVAFAPDGRRVLSGGDDRTVRLWDADTGKELRCLRGHDHYVFGVALSGDGGRALSASLDRTVRLWDVEKGEEIRRFTGHTDTVLGVAFCPDGRHALSASTDRTLRLWDLETAQAVRVFRGHKGYVHAVAVAPDGRRALSAGQDHSVRLWDVDTGEEVQRLDGHTDMVWSVAFSGDGRFGLSASHDATVRLWGAAKRQ
jgi:hypothetical protein